MMTTGNLLQLLNWLLQCKLPEAQIFVPITTNAMLAVFAAGKANALGMPTLHPLSFVSWA
jgi:hypothetical protein